MRKILTNHSIKITLTLKPDFTRKVNYQPIFLITIDTKFLKKVLEYKM